ncbi:gamma carbonic anhydrase family protein [Pelistega sp. NLN82]|uniref:Gamma carbonic anhydrase family protein n=1 Tax=Pelistega ratti TaxID=2652177 RepID=A0A6L9Y5X7_9BURK|nr:gamma carbonic anhydrase family protein [Pelistega ratti]NEN75890.1 gamma carbonic anhydrase family protein [Pelistega ratti]
MAIYQLHNLIPSIDPSAYIFENATIIGNVSIKANVSIWSHVSIRADNDSITIDENSNVQEGAVLHVDQETPMYIGKNVTIGHQAMLHGCTIQEGSLIGMQAIVLNRAVIGKNCLIAAGAIIPEGKIIPDNSLVIGVAKIARTLSEEDIQQMQKGTANYVERAKYYREYLKQIA